EPFARKPEHVTKLAEEEDLSVRLERFGHEVLEEDELTRIESLEITKRSDGIRVVAHLPETEEGGENRNARTLNAFFCDSVEHPWTPLFEHLEIEIALRRRHLHMTYGFDLRRKVPFNLRFRAPEEKRPGFEVEETGHVG